MAGGGLWESAEPRKTKGKGNLKSQKREEKEPNERERKKR
jgi:hypothetical protein